MRPTKGEISCTLAWPQATAWQNENSSVRLVWMPRSSSWRAASMPSQVEAILMSTRSMCTPSAWYSSIRRSARATVAEVLKDRRASTSVETRPGMVFRISQPKRTSMRSMTSSRLRPLYWATVARISGAELERREATLKSAQATLDQAKAQLASQSNQEAYAQLLADVPGVVTGIDAEPG